jgi:hypothetical protein
MASFTFLLRARYLFHAWLFRRNTEILSEPKDKANVLNDQYTSVFTREPPGQIPDIDGTPIPPMTDIKFTSPGS